MYAKELDLPYSATHPGRTFLRLLKVSPLQLLGLLALHLIKMSPMLLLPVFISKCIWLADERPDGAVDYLLWMSAGYLLLAASNIPTHMWYISNTSRIVRGMELRLRSALVRRLQHLSMSFHNERERGRLQTKVLRDVEQLVQLAELTMQHAIASVLSLSYAFIYTLLNDAMVALCYVIAAPVAITLIRFFRHAMSRRNDELRTNVEDMSQRVLEMIDMVPVTRAHGLEEVEVNEIANKLHNVRNKGRRVDMINALFASSAFVVSMSAIGTITCAVTALVLIGDMSLDRIALYTTLFQMVVNSIQGILNFMPQIAKGFSSIRSIGEVLECPDIEANEGKTTVSEVAGELEFRQVTFTYPGSHTPAVKDFNLKVNTGQCIAFVGASGSGKSTLMQLAIGFLRPTIGEIYLDGKAMSELDMRTWRRHIAVVPQQTILFSGTLRNNITYGLPNVRDEQVNAAIETAHLKDVVASLPEGLETLVGENGMKLSGGQRQRLAIARAIIRDPRFIILDEATSALDVISEHEVQLAIENLVANRTTFIVAHRLSTIRQAGLVVVMNHGQAIEMGTQDELLARKGAFSELKALQQS